MRRADRLFQIMLILQEGKVVTGKQIAERVEVSLRTVYRDMDDLLASGVPIDSDAGVGYLLRGDYRLPPLMFNVEELKALALGAKMVTGWADDELRSATTTALRKIEAALPDKLKPEVQMDEIQVLDFYLSGPLRQRMALIRHSIKKKHKIQVSYKSLSDEYSQRILWPLGLFFWGGKWTLGAWCELRKDYRTFRIDKVLEIEELSQSLADRPDVSLQGYLDSIKEA